MDQYLIDKMEEDAAKAKEEADGADLTQLGIMALRIENRIKEHEASADQLKKQLERMMRYSIPEALAAAGVPEFGFEHEDGTARMVKGTKVVGSLNSAPNQAEAIEYLEANGLRGAIKTSVAIDFDKDEEEAATRTVETLRSTTNKHVDMTRTIHPQTLMAFVRSKLEDDPTFDYEKVGCTAITEAKFTKRR